MNMLNFTIYLYFFTIGSLLMVPQILLAQNEIIEYHSVYEEKFFNKKSSSDLFHHLVATDPKTTEAVGNLHLNELEELVRKVNAKKFRTQEQKLKCVFYQIHRKYLKKYEQYSVFTDIFNSGTYDCLTGTALYAYVYDKLGFQTSLYETNYHVYLLVSNANRAYLIESTDPFGGFVTDGRTIQKLVNQYLKDNKDNENDSYVFSEEFFVQTDIHSLPALLYYNQAVYFNNRKQTQLAWEAINKASLINQSKRIQEIRALIAANVQLHTSYERGGI